VLLPRLSYEQSAPSSHNFLFIFISNSYFSSHAKISKAWELVSIVGTHVLYLVHGMVLEIKSTIDTRIR
jgi:hypothetical protein